MISLKNRKFLTSAFGCCISLLGLLYGVFWDSMFNYLLEKAMILRPNSMIFDLWTKPPMQVVIDFYFFNWTNPESFNDLSIKPVLQELGPYRFFEEPEKFNVMWHSKNASVTYSKRSKYYFDPTGSNGSLDDKIVTLNSLALAVASKTKFWNPMRRTLADLALRVYHKDIALRKTARELLFEGFEDTLINFGNAVPSSISNVKVPFDRYGYCYPRNTSSFSSTFNIHTGADNIRNYAKVNTWNYKNETDYFPGKCGKMAGTTGEFQPPYLQKDQPITTFVPDFCRPITLDYSEPVSVAGIEGFRYVGGDRLMDNGTRYPENVCFCNGECVPSGLMNISSCWYGLPLFASYPHFYKADPYYLQQFEGIKPRKDLHELYLVLEPRTSLLLDVGARFQMNVLVEPIPDLKLFQSTRKIFFPLMWFDAKTRVTPELADYIRSFPKYILYGQIFGSVCFAVGLIVAFWQPLSNRLRGNVQIAELGKELPSDKSRSKSTFALLPELEVSALLAKKQKSIIEESDKATLDNIGSWICKGSWGTNSNGWTTNTG